MKLKKLEKNKILLNNIDDLVKNQKMKFLSV